LFFSTVDFVYETWGKEAFFNLQNDFSRLRSKFYPTIYDSIMIATAIMLERKAVVPVDIKERRILLVKDKDYRESITQGTMQPRNINMRVTRALKMLYELDL